LARLGLSSLLFVLIAAKEAHVRESIIFLLFLLGWEVLLVIRVDEPVWQIYISKVIKNGRWNSSMLHAAMGVFRLRGRWSNPVFGLESFLDHHLANQLLALEGLEFLSAAQTAAEREDTFSVIFIGRWVLDLERAVLTTAVL